MSKITGFHISDKAIRILKFYCLQYGTTMSKVIEMLIYENLQLPGALATEAEENTSESE